MIKANFFTEGDMLTGFEICGHSGYSEQGSDIVCSAVSSAAYMTANTLTEVLNIEADIKLNQDGFFSLTVEPQSDAQAILKGFEIHIEALAQDYPENIKVKSKRRCQ